MAKKVSVTSVTPASKVKATSKAQQARTRNLVMGIATATPAGRAAKVAVTAAKAAKATKAVNSSRQAGDYVVKGSSAKSTIPNAGKADAPYLYGKDAQISSNVSIKNATSPSGKQSIRGGSAQIMNQNARLSAPVSKAEAKANARGLKAAQGKSLASPVKKVTIAKNAKERLVAKNIASANIKVFKANPKEAYAKSAKAAEDMKARDIKFAKKSPNTYDKKTMKNVKLKKK